MSRTEKRKVIDLNINEWQELLTEFKQNTPKRKLLRDYANAPAAMRIENTPLTTARYAGGCIYNGKLYTYFEPVVPEEKSNPDGSPYVAWLLVRDDFLRWAANKLKTENGRKK